MNVNIPGLYNPQNGYYYIDDEAFANFLNENYDVFPESYHMVFEQVILNCHYYDQAELIPVIAWNPRNGNIFATSMERIEGLFNQ